MRNRLKALRELKQWSQSDLARQLGVSRQAVNGFESGKFDPSLEMGLKIAHLLNVAVEDVFTYEAKEAKTVMQTLVEQVKNFFGLEFGFERFTEPAIAAVKFAQTEAARLQVAQIEPQHLLAGLLAEPATTAGQLLRANGAIAISTPAGVTQAGENLKFSAKSKIVLELALQAARLQGSQSIDTEHLLWGLLRLTDTRENSLSDTLQECGINVVELNRQLAEIV